MAYEFNTSSPIQAFLDTYRKTVDQGIQKDQNQRAADMEKAQLEQFGIQHGRKPAYDENGRFKGYEDQPDLAPLSPMAALVKQVPNAPSKGSDLAQVPYMSSPADAMKSPAPTLEDMAKERLAKMQGAAPEAAPSPMQQKRMLLDTLYPEMKNTPLSMELVQRLMQQAPEAITAQRNLAAQKAKQDLELGKEGYVRDPNAEGGLRALPGGAADIEKAYKQAQTTRALRDPLEKMDFSRQTQIEKQDNQIHDRVIQRIAKDPTMKARLQQYGNLENALNNFMAKTPTPQSFDELQQAVRSNLGIKGTSSVGEREKTFLDSMGLSADRWQQFLTGNPADIGKDSAFAKHIRGLADQEQKNIRGQVEKRINSLSAGHGSLYKRRPDLKMDLMDATGALQSEFGAAPASGGGGGGLTPEEQQELEMLRKKHGR